LYEQLLHEHELQQQLEQQIVLEEDIVDEEDVASRQLSSVADVRKSVSRR